MMNEKFRELNRISILLNKTREEVARDNVTQAEVERITDHIDQRFNRLEEKIDQLIRQKGWLIVAGINTLLQLGRGAGLNIPQGVVDAGMFIGNPGMFLLNKALSQLESSAGLPVGLAQAVQNPKGQLIDYAKTQAGNSILDTNDVSNLEALLYQLQLNQFDQARSAGEGATPVNSSITDFEVTPANLADLFGGQGSATQDLLSGGNNSGFEQLLESYGGGGGKYFDDQSMATMAMAKGGKVCGCK